MRGEKKKGKKPTSKGEEKKKPAGEVPCYKLISYPQWEKSGGTLQTRLKAVKALFRLYPHTELSGRKNKERRG